MWGHLSNTRILAVTGSCKQWCKIWMEKIGPNIKPYWILGFCFFLDIHRSALLAQQLFTSYDTIGCVVVFLHLISQYQERLTKRNFFFFLKATTWQASSLGSAHVSVMEHLPQSCPVIKTSLQDKLLHAAVHLAYNSSLPLRCFWTSQIHIFPKMS